MSKPRIRFVGLAVVAYASAHAFSSGGNCPISCGVGSADVNGCGSVNITDLGIVINNWATAGPGDTNGDGLVELADLTNVLAQFGDLNCSSAPNTACDNGVSVSAGAVEPFGPSPVGLATFDLSITLNAGDSWLTAAIEAWTWNGATIRYQDPNMRVTNPYGSDPVADEFITFLSKPRTQTGAMRFKNNGAPLELDNFTIATATALDVTVFNSAGDFSETTSGYITRVVLDLSATVFDPNSTYVATGGAQCPGDVPLLTAQSRVGGAPCACILDIDWEVYATSVSACGAACDTAGGDADVDCDCDVDITDLGAVLANFGQSGQSPADGDTNGDGLINITDLGDVLAKFGTTCPP